jgi:hypothetical protein
MRAIATRLSRLEKRLGPGRESEAAWQLKSRLEKARMRCGLPPISIRLDELRGMSVSQILIKCRH